MTPRQFFSESGQPACKKHFQRLLYLFIFHFLYCIYGNFNALIVRIFIDKAHADRFSCFHGRDILGSLSLWKHIFCLKSQSVSLNCRRISRSAFIILSILILTNPDSSGSFNTFPCKFFLLRVSISE